MLERKPHLKQHFVIPGEKKQPHLTSGASLYGRILIKAWENNIQNVNLLVAEHASNAVRVSLPRIGMIFCFNLNVFSQYVNLTLNAVILGSR